MAMDHRYLRVFFNWLNDREDAPRIMRKVPTPAVAEQPVDVFTPDELRRLLDTTKGNDFVQRRDRAQVLPIICRRERGNRNGVMPILERG